MAEEENVKVAVRVRPFNSREKAMGSDIDSTMDGPRTVLTDPDTGEEKDFVFDYSYWSHDGSVEQANGYITPAAGTRICRQKKVYDDLGTGVAKNAWDGYNSTLFAYGQTGSGKSWSVVGYGINKGIVPMFSEELFHGIDEKKQAGSKTQFEVKFSMLEIYSEKVRDLLNPTPNKKKSLKIREHPKKGFYVEGLKTQYVDTYAAIEQQMEEGTHNRTIAATNMNATSSRAHTIVGITFIQKSKNKAGQETAKSSIVNLVDLAGSERAESTGATGDRLKEGAAINQSLSALGNVIAALADNAGGKKMKVPFRDSVLTKLLKNALGGNSKTIMVAAISPADINYSETLSTLRYGKPRYGLTMSRINEARKTTPNLYNLNMDAQLSGMICHLLEVGENTIGNKGCDITLQGPSMLERHAKIVYSNVHEPHGMFRLERMNTDARTLVNGEPLTGDEAEELHHNDRVMFGTTQLYVFVNPRQRDDVAVATTWMMPTYESAQNEIASHAGLAVSTETKSQELEELRRKLEEEMKAELEENEREMEEMRKSYEEKLKAAEESAG
ncbi:PREDICTED: kinesin-like protein KIF28P, partial [Priapulus caudatus]|uniref:Kinesin-like protein KIF28P n=1 Tax=Priapulus caudatus TaxID=37621 RepID=A0ABM1EST8_PRICU